MISAAFVPLVVVLLLELVGVDHELGTDLGVITAAALLIVVALPGAYLHGVRGWGLAIITLLIVVMTSALVVAKVWLTQLTPPPGTDQDRVVRRPSDPTVPQSGG
jgi:hypothetical protein